MSRFVLLALLFTITAVAGLAQSEQPAKKGPQKGAVLLETEYNLIGGILGGGSGLTLLSSGGGTAVGLGIDGGFFVGNRTAVLGKLGLLTADGTSITSIGSGIKHYFAGVIPVGAELGLIFASDASSGGGATTFTWAVNGGYAARLADNIYFEPFVGVLGFEGGGSFQGGARFAMLLGRGR